VKWVCAFAIALAVAWASTLSTASAQETQRDPLIAPGEGAAGSRFQVVGQTGWTPGETVTLEFGFSDAEPGASYAGPFYHQREVTVLRDGTWSFPVVVNSELFPFPLWRPGFIVVRATSASHQTTNTFVYSVEGRRPGGLPPLAELGFGPGDSSEAGGFAATLAMFAAGIGVLLAASGVMRRRRRMASE
jgi:hypothetical protein